MAKGRTMWRGNRSTASIRSRRLSGKPAIDEAARTMVAEVHRDLLQYLTRRLGDRDDAAEVLQQFHLKVFSRISSIRDTTRLRGWLRRVLETTLIDYLRAKIRERQRHVELASVADELAVEPMQNALDAAICACLYKLLPTLRPQYAEVLWRADILGSSKQTLSAQLGISADNLRVRLHRARQALKLRLEQSCRTCPIHGFLDCACAETTNPAARQRHASARAGVTKPGDQRPYRQHTEPTPTRPQQARVARSPSDAQGRSSLKRGARHARQTTL
jgi:RNA polymerase sigma factor (sigma-70 family)